MTRRGPRTLHYRFRFSTGAEHQFDVSLDPATLLDQSPPPAHPPPWTALSFHKCPNCPLSSVEHAHCPAALRVADVIGAVSALESIDRADIDVDVNGRTSHRTAAVSEGLASLLGLRMATSGCPILAKLRPMARLHLPFATEDETTFRALATYLIAQLLKQQAGETANWSLDGLKEAYAAVGVVNRAFAARLWAALSADAGANALVKLDLFAKLIPLELNEWLAEFAGAFEAWR